MKRLLTIIAVLSFFLASSAAFGLEIVDQFPTFSSKRVFTTDPLTVIFDQSLNTGTVNDSSFFVILKGDTAHVAGTLSFQTTSSENDTVIFTPDVRWKWGQRYQLQIATTVTSASADPFSGTLPDLGIFSANIPNDLRLLDWDPSDPSNYDEDSNVLIGFNPLDPEADSEPWEIPGMNVTGAWKYTRGRSDVLIGILDDGIKYYDREVRRAFFLNRGELPVPNENGTPCASYDCNGDGRFDVDDYELDSRLPGGGTYDALDLINTFSDGIDDDGNGLPDDISGWDFFRHSNLTLGVPSFPEGSHGGGEIDLISSEGDNGIGRIPGLCPDCMVIPVRASAGIIYDYSYLSAAARYAMSMGASVLNFAGANYTWSEEGHQAFKDAVQNGAVTVGASGDEMSFHHWMPAAGEDVINVKTLFPLPPVELSETFNLGTYGFTETYCTNYGTHCQLAVPARTGCTSDSTGNTTGMLGLLFSYAKDLGIELSGDEAMQLMFTTATDVEDHCASIVNLLDVCQPGYDMHFGYGRPDLQKAMIALGDPDFGVPSTIPPAVRVDSPKWWQNVYPDQTPNLEVVGTISSRVTPFDWEVQIAKGNQPLDGEFITVDSGSASGTVDGLITSIPLEEYFDEQWLTRKVENQYTYEVTIRVRAGYDSGNGVVTGENRKSISVLLDNDPDHGLVQGFPMDVGASGESAPLLYDLDGDLDQHMEVIFGGGDGRVHVYKFDSGTGGWSALPGFPFDLTGDDLWVSDTIFASVAVGDIFGDGAPEIVAATLQGKIYAIDPMTATLLPGFPVSADARDNSSAYTYAFGNGFFASPVLADLDKDGVLEIIAASVDQKVYAFKLSQNGVAPLSGWPVLCRSEAGAVPTAKVCEGQDIPSQILGTPAVGILDPTSDNVDISEYPAVVLTTTESCNGGSLPTSRAYALFHDGNDNADGPFLPGWPQAITAPLGDSIPIPMTAGSPLSPAISPRENGSDIVVGTTAWFPILIKYNEGKISQELVPVVLAVSMLASPGYSSLFVDGKMQIVVSLTGALRWDELGFHLLNSRLFGIDVEAPHTKTLEGRIEDFPMLGTASVADLNNDGIREVVGGSGGYLVHAFSPGKEKEIQGWPKYTQKWVMAAPVVGDMDADGKMEVVVQTREGALYAWNSPGQSCWSGVNNSDWRRFHHDERNTGYYGADTLPPIRVADLSAVIDADSSATMISFTAPGDDWACGTAAEYDLRYSTDSGVELSDPNQFALAETLQNTPPVTYGGTELRFYSELPEGATIALRSVDEVGNLSFISNVAVVTKGQATDDDDDNAGDDDTPTDDDDNDDTPQSSSDDDDDGACCG